MRPRIRLARVALQAANFIQSLPLVVMRPDDLVEFSRQSYAAPENIESWVKDAVVDGGLFPEELDLLEDVPSRSGELLVLGVGGGREAIPLAQMGFRVTGVDYVPAMVERAMENAARRGVNMGCLVQDISRLDVPAGKYDVVWLSRATFSAVPTRKRRVEMVRRIARALKPGGLFLCQFQRTIAPARSRRGLLARRLVAACTLGNLGYEDGDTLWGNEAFVHCFRSDDVVRAELEEGGLSVLRFQTDPGMAQRGVVSKKAP